MMNLGRQPRRKLRVAAVILVLLTAAVRPLAWAQEKTGRPLTLEDCLLEALKNNPLLAAARYDLDIGLLRVTEARASLFPSLSLGSGLDHSSAVGRAGASGGSSSYGASLSARATLFQGGKIAAAVDAARAISRSSSHQYESQVQDLVQNITALYYRILQAGGLVGVAEQSIEQARFHRESAVARNEAGLGRRSDILKADVELSAASLGLIRAVNARRSLEGSLNVLMGREAQPRLVLADREEAADITERLELDQLLQASYSSRPEMKRMEALTEAQQADIRAARGARAPWISADTSFSFAGSSSISGQGNWSIGLSLSLPVFNGFALSSRLAQEEVALKSLDRQNQSVRQQISLDVWTAYLDLKEAEERINNAETFLLNARENLEIAEGEYREGVGSMIEVIDAQTALVAAEVNRIEARTDYRIARSALKRAVGGFRFKEN